MSAADRGSEAAEVSATTRGWLISGLMFVALGLALASLGSVVAGPTWWLSMMFVAGIVMGVAAVVRSFANAPAWPIIASIVAGTVTMTAFFVPATAVGGLIPTPDSLDAFRRLADAGAASIADQSIPATADQGLLYLLCLGAAATGLALDLAAFGLRRPSLSGVPLGVVLLVPSYVNSRLTDPWLFAATAVVYLGILLVGMPAIRWRTVAGVTATAVIAALVLPQVIPSVDASVASSGGGGGAIATGINPILNLGSDLRQADPALALTYSSSAIGGEYLRLTALDDFGGSAWAPTETGTDPSRTVGAIGTAPGLSDAVRRTIVTSNITVGDILSRWLPAPYAPESVTGLAGDWSWEPEALAIRTERSNARGQQYTVTSVEAAPTVEQLVAAGTTVDPGFDRYLVLPPQLPPVVASTALTVVGAAPTNFDKAIALQSYFRGPQFTYSEQAPVDDDYDGSGAQVLAAFLDRKAGYCVHFASAMASMARTLGIPARVAVGFTPGQPATDGVAGANDSAGIQYRVSTRDLHSWPELYFSGIGWVRFEPTPSRGIAPSFAPAAKDNPATPNVDESRPSTAATEAPGAAPSPGPTRVLPGDEVAVANGSKAATAVSPWWWALLGVLVILFVPGIMRAARRRRRISHGTAASAWAELVDTADDAGIPPDDSRTPRQTADHLLELLDADAAAALDRLRADVEFAVFGGRTSAPDPSDLPRVRRALLRRLSPGRRLLAVLAPRSLVRPWLPAPIVAA